MDRKIQGLKNNMRFKILTINGNYYLLDIAPSVLKSLFPFLFWVFPLQAFRIDGNVVKGLKLERKKQKTSVNTMFFIAGTVILFPKFLDPLVDFLNLQTSISLNIIITIITILMVVSIRIYINYLNRKDLYRVVNLESLTPSYVQVRPKSFKNYFKVFWLYNICWGSENI